MKNTTTYHKGKGIPFDRDNIDTDQIIPKQFLKSIKKSGFGPNLFDAWRYEDEGFPGQDINQRKINEDFIFLVSSTSPRGKTIDFFKLDKFSFNSLFKVGDLNSF